jgi:predicted nucleic acid-binding OB-fold protein
MKFYQILPDRSPDITVVPVISVETTQSPKATARHEEDTKVDVVSGSVCTLLENVLKTIVEVTVVNEVRVGVGVHAAISCQ